MILDITKAKEYIDTLEDRLGVYVCETLKSTLEDVNSKLPEDMDDDERKDELVNSVLNFVQTYCVAGPGRRVSPSVPKPFTETEMLDKIYELASTLEDDDNDDDEE
jgi:hypothetical protein